MTPRVPIHICAIGRQVAWRTWDSFPWSVELQTFSFIFNTLFCPKKKIWIEALLASLEPWDQQHLWLTLSLGGCKWRDSPSFMSSLLFLVWNLCGSWLSLIIRETPMYKEKMQDHVVLRKQSLQEVQEQLEKGTMGQTQLLGRVGSLHLIPQMQEFVLSNPKPITSPLFEI